MSQYPVSAPAAAAPFNATLANVVKEKDLKSEKKHLDHVPLDKAATTEAGGIHIGPGKGQADYAPGVKPVQQHSVSSVGAFSQGGNQLTRASHSGEVSVQSNVVMDTITQSQEAGSKQINELLSRLSTTTQQVSERDDATELFDCIMHQHIIRTIAH
jgi:hypothetical protein